MKPKKNYRASAIAILSLLAAAGAIYPEGHWTPLVLLPLMAFASADVARTFLPVASLSLGRNELPVYSTLLEEGMDVNDLPDSYDAREAWANCSSISLIADQGACGDCWAVATITAATDRWCIAKGGGAANNPPLSVETMVGCCHVCGYGCGDGFYNYAWAWLAGKKGSPYGVVTGSSVQGDFSYCSSYTVPQCNHYDSANDTLPSCEKGPPAKTPTCPTSCDAGSKYPTPFAQDVHRFSSSYAVPTDETSIRAEIFKHGPVTTGFNVYSDWVTYTGGVYKATGGEEMGGHAVKIVGWGTQANENYWLVTNSFGKKWGVDGMFKILRGVGECGIESNIVAGLV
jgi:cathepsin B